VPASTVARVYAETLLRFAEREGALDQATEGLEAIDAAIAADEEFARFLGAPQIAADDKRSLLHAAFEKRLHPAVMRFLDLVVAKHREPQLPEIAAAWRDILDRRANRQGASVTSAVAADPALLERLRAALEKATGKTIALEERVDPRLLGGVVVRTGDLVMDASLKTRLATLRHRLRMAGRARA
jgi:F-type H+-transporting ATPase subunit delta